MAASSSGGPSGGNVVSFSTAGAKLSSLEGTAAKSFNNETYAGWHYGATDQKLSGTQYVITPDWNCYTIQDVAPDFQKAAKYRTVKYASPAPTLNMEPRGIAAARVPQKTASTAKKLDKPLSIKPLAERSGRASGNQNAIRGKFRAMAERKAQSQTRSRGGGLGR